MTPYYADDAVTIYHGDCREWMPEADAVVTDPPYGVNAQQKDHAAGSGPVVTWDAEYPHAVINEAVVRYATVIAFGAAPMIGRELRAFATVPRVLIWNPRFRLGMIAKDGIAFRYHPIYAWGTKNEDRTIRDVFDEPTEAGNWWNHPATKPVRLMRALVGLTTGTVLDPFMGSGTTLVAAKWADRRAIGIEIEERYCEIAAKRCAQEVLGLSA